MPVDAVTCSSCRAECTPGTVTCPSCGASVDLSRATGDAPGSASWSKLQAALGPTCELRRFLGRGGFADVYVAWDVRLKREIAVKTLRADLIVSTAVLERFQREAESVARLRHPNIVPIFWVGEADQMAYFTMPLIEGETLARLLARERALDVSAACRVLLEAANALAAAHRSGVVHRDVKPDNIMLEGTERRAILMDFGIAMTADADARGLTGTGIVLGTPRYMSPEQATGERGIGPASDQYSLAVVAYHMLAGQLPFEGSTQHALIASQLTKQAVPIRERRPEVPAGVEAVVMRALSREPADRFASMDEFVVALTTAAQGLLVQDVAGVHALSMRERCDRAKALVERYWLRAAVVAALGAALTVALRHQVAPQAIRQLAGQREEARYAATAWLKDRGVRANGSEAMIFSLVGTPYARSYRYAAQILGPTRALDTLLQTGMWGWSMRFPDRDRNEWWVVHTGGDGRVMAFDWQQRDSVATPLVTADSARRIAERELVVRGWNPDSLRTVSVWSEASARRSTHSFTWARRDWVIRGAGDSLTYDISARVVGSRVAAFFQGPATPDTFTTDWPAAIGTLVQALNIALSCVIVAVAILVAFRQRSARSLQWSVGIRLALSVIVLFVVGRVVPQFSSFTVPWGPWLSQAQLAGSYIADFSLQLIPVFVSVGLLGIVGVTLASASRPWLSAGLKDVTMGRLLPPELVPSALAGYAGGLALLAFQSVALLVSRTALGMPLLLPVSVGFHYSLPWVEAAQDLAEAIGFGVAFLFLITVGDRYRLRAPLPELVFALMVMSMIGSLSGEPVAKLAIDVVLITGCASIARRAGVLASIIAMYVMINLPFALDMIDAARAPFYSAGIIECLLLGTPALLGYLSWRRIVHADRLNIPVS